MKPAARQGDIGRVEPILGVTPYPTCPPPYPVLIKQLAGAQTVFSNLRGQTFMSTVGWDRKIVSECQPIYISKAVTGSQTVFVENKPAHRFSDVGIIDQVLIGGKIVQFKPPFVYRTLTGSTDIFIGDTSNDAVPLVNTDSTARSVQTKLPALDITAAEEYQVTQGFSGTPEQSIDAGVSLITPKTITTPTIIEFLNKTLKEAETGLWDETWSTGKSNPNIIGIWSELGFPSEGMFLTDHTNWSMGFVNLVLRRTGHRYVQTCNAEDIRTRSTDYNATEIPLDQGKIGDIGLWSYTEGYHVNFIHSVNNGKYSFIGGDQISQEKYHRTPNTGTVAMSWKDGYDVNKQRTLISLWRPSAE